MQQPTISAVDAERIKHEIMHELVQRQSWPSYQSMAVRFSRFSNYADRRRSNENDSRSQPSASTS